jgi:hypothetical protein
MFKSDRCKTLYQHTMFKGYNTWYRNLTPLKKLLVIFTCYLFLVATINLIIYKFILEEKRSAVFYLGQAVWLALLFIALWDWPTVKKVFSRNRTSNTITQKQK